MKDETLSISKKELIGLLTKAFEAGWGGYKDLCDDIVSQIITEHVKKKNKQMSPTDKDIAHLKEMSEKIGGMLRGNIEFVNETNPQYQYGTVNNNRYAQFTVNPSYYGNASISNANTVSADLLPNGRLTLSNGSRIN